MDRVAVINTLITARGYRSYLEIGCQADECFSRVGVPDIKIGVDPISGGTLRMPSDEFFAMNQIEFDLIFIDGSHQHDQVWRDICNALDALSPDGTIVMHDCLPPDADHERLDLCGTAWRAFAKTRERIELESYCGDFDYGVGVIYRATNTAPIRVDRPLGDLSYADFVAHRDDWMRPRSPEQIADIAMWIRLPLQDRRPRPSQVVEDALAKLRAG